MYIYIYELTKKKLYKIGSGYQKKIQEHENILLRNYPIFGTYIYVKVRVASKRVTRVVCCGSKAGQEAGRHYCEAKKIR